MDSRAVPAVSLRQLQYIVAVADSASFRQAAESCHVAQPSLSAQVARAEAQLGVQLFERGRGGVRLTHAGEAVVAQARQVLLAAHDLRAVAQQFTDPFTGTMRVGVIPTVGPYLLPDIAPAVTPAFPKLTLLWTEDRTASLVQMIQDGSLDAAVIALEADIGTCEYAVLGRDAFVLAGSRTHPLLESTKPVDPSELAGVPLLLLADGHCFRDQVLDVCSGLPALKEGFQATSLSTLVQMAGSGAGVTLLPMLSVPVENRRGQLRVRHFAVPAPARTLVLAWRRGSALRPAMSRIADTMRKAWKAGGRVKRAGKA